MSTYLSQNDTIMWMVEADPLLRSTITGVLLLESTPDWHRVRERVERVTHEVPSLRKKVVTVPLHPNKLRWVDDHDFDLSYHVRHIRLWDGSDVQDLLDWARTEAMGGFDPARPLWEFTLVEGLPDGRAAFVTKAHHVVTDGVGAVQIAAHLFDFEPEPMQHEPIDPSPTAHTGSAAILRDVLVQDVAGAAGFARHQVGSALPTLLRVVRRPHRAVADALATAGSVGRFLAPTMVPRSEKMVGRMLASSFRVLEVEVPPLRAAAKAAGGRLNDAFLAGITAGLQHYHEHHGHDIRRLRVAMPISQREEQHAEAGNHITVTRFTLPVDQRDPKVRIGAMRSAVERVRRERALEHTEAIAGFLNLMPKGVVGAMLKGVDFLASNVPGVPVPMWLQGAKVQRFFPFGPTIGSALNVTLMSYDGVCCMGVNSDDAAVPDPDVLVACLRSGFAEVCSVTP